MHKLRGISAELLTGIGVAVIVLSVISTVGSLWSDRDVMGGGAFRGAQLCSGAYGIAMGTIVIILAQLLAALRAFGDSQSAAPSSN